jgi:hypothetical protein
MQFAISCITRPAHEPMLISLPRLPSATRGKDSWAQFYITTCPQCWYHKWCGTDHPFQNFVLKTFPKTVTAMLCHHLSPILRHHMTAMLISQLSFFSIKLFLQTFSNLIFSQSFHLLIISKNFLQNFCKSPHNLHVVGCNSSQMCMSKLK